MSEENKAIVQRFVDGVINQKNMATFDEVIASNAVAHHVPPGLSPDVAGWKAMVGGMLGGLPDARITLDDVVADGDRVVARWTMKLTRPRRPMYSVVSEGGPWTSSRWTS